MRVLIDMIYYSSVFKAQASKEYRNMLQEHESWLGAVSGKMSMRAEGSLSCGSGGSPLDPADQISYSDILYSICDMQTACFFMYDL